ncbi:MAG: hypothetical protein IJ756_06535 [Paludibacteraceae bacterium]|nr:hypothetical protein [Paludibacteraceae bacterium]
MELHFLQLHCIFLSNSFAFAILSGVFVSSFAVLLIDIYDYHNKKPFFEQLLWVNYANLYGQFLSAQYNIKRALNNPQQLYLQILRQQIPTLKSIIGTIQTIDYATIFNYCERNPLVLMHKDFIQSKAPIISSIIDDFIYLELAVNTDKMKQLELQLNNSNVIEKQLTNETLIKLEHQIPVVLKALDDVLVTCERHKPKQFSWQKTKTQLISFQTNFNFQEIEDFLKEDIKTL